MSGSPLLPSGSPAPLMNGRCPIFVEHGADPREEPGLQAPPFSVCVVGADYYIKCGPNATDWDPPACANADAFRYLVSIPGQHNYLDSGFNGPITLVFNRVVKPETVVLGSSLILGGEALDELEPITFEVISNTIVLHNEIGGGDDWQSEGQLTIQMTAAILSVADVTLQQPAEDVYSWQSG